MFPQADTVCQFGMIRHHELQAEARRARHMAQADAARIAPGPRRVVAIDAGTDAKEDIMVPGITETACRITGLRDQALLAEADRQRQAAFASPVPAGRVRVMATIGCHIGAITEQIRHLLAGSRTHDVMDPVPVPRTLVVH